MSILDMGRRTTKTAEFFDQLDRRGHEPGLEEVDGTIRFDLRDEDGIHHWFVAIENGDVRVSRAAHPADCVVHTDRTLFDQLVTGQLRVTPAWLRNQFRLEGNDWLMRSFDRIFPGPANAHHPRDLVTNRGRRR